MPNPLYTRESSKLCYHVIRDKKIRGKQHGKKKADV